ncbi:MAG: glycosyltransferase family 4 protein [Chloroflexota bacterium]|nr:glycosyltransferase family 4 protein [Chloroflexota bacterium]
MSVPDQDNHDAYGLVQASGLFDAKFYLDSNPEMGSGAIDPLAHYMSFGVAEGRDPNPLFDTSFYLESNPQVSRAGINPVYHYVTCGAAEGCDPNPYFDTLLYADDLRETVPAGTTPLAHYLSDPGVARGLPRVWRSGDLQLNWTEYQRQLVQSTFCYTAERKALDVRETGGADHFRRAIIVAAQDAEPAEPQLIALSVVRELVGTYDLEVVVLLRRGGPLFNEFVALAPTVILQDDSDQSHLVDRALDELLTTLRMRGVDGAICYGVMTGDIAERLKSNGLRVVTAIHELPHRAHTHGVQRLLQQAYTNSDRLVFPTQFVQKRIASKFSLIPRSTYVHAQGVLRPNPFVNEREFARFQIAKQLGIRAGAPIVLGCGQASQRKGYDLFIQMARLVTQQTGGKEVHFIWIGENDGDFTSECLEDVERCGLAERVHTQTAQGYPGLFYAAADVFALPSREDPFPTACLEAMEAGLPVVAFEAAGGIGEAIGNDAGILVPYLDVQAMAAVVRNLIDDPKRRVSLGSRGQQRIDEEFQLSQYVNFLMRLMNSTVHLNDHASATS